MVVDKYRIRVSAAKPPKTAKAPKKDPFLIALGERVRLLRARRGLTRKGVAVASGVSERHLANLEYGIGNASILILQQVATALDCALAELVGDVTTSTPDWLMLRELLQGKSDSDVRRARLALSSLFGNGRADPLRGRRLALIGLRGAGKSTLGAMLADALELPFVELSREIEKIAGCSIREIHDLYGTAAYRRYERRALDEVVKAHAAVVIATPGGIVAEPATFEQLLTRCTTIWLQASPEEHMGRVAAQGDTRPMAASREAMDDLRRILAGRAAFYSKADAVIDTSGRLTAQSFATLAALAADLADVHEVASAS
ncbi:MAG: helix-turn-helix transcriptional regulator [Pseudomonadota bacterium]|nr:helix-turn-helix transcriptional regulator [Pseudomonadota bacterium]